MVAKFVCDLRDSSPVKQVDDSGRDVDAGVTLKTFKRFSVGGGQKFDHSLPANLERIPFCWTQSEYDRQVQEACAYVERLKAFSDHKDWIKE